MTSSRTFRERRDLYLKTLEQQVKRLRISEAEMQHEMDRLRSEISKLQGKLERNEGGHVRNFSRSFTMDSSRRMTLASTMQGQQDSSNVPRREVAMSEKVVAWTEFHQGQPRKLHVRHHSDSEVWGGGSPDVSSQEDQFSMHHNFSLSSRLSGSYVSDIDPVTLAMEFVLK